MRPLAPLLLLSLAGCRATGTPAAPACATVRDGDMAWIPSGAVTLGKDARYPEEGPPRRIDLPGFWLSTHEVTVREFARFVAATGYRTVAERAPPVTPETPADMRRPGSAVFATPDDADPRWWRWRTGAQWRRPEALAPAPAAEPVVQIAYADARAYARWRGMALPSEAQWERAARAGGVDVEHTPPEHPPVANVWQGPFPARDLAGDGYAGRAPVGCFPRDRAGLYDMIGNVWEWTRDTDASGVRGVIKGGSYLCAANYCARYRPAARQFQERGLGTDHIGFRVVDPRRPPPPGARP
jgi:formylglycine-generating enzyme required for sulfatase activity